MSNEKALVPAALTDFAVAKYAPEDLAEAIQENLADSDIGPFDLERIKVPSQGITKFVVPTLDNPDGDMIDKVSGVILMHQKMRSYWENQDSAQEGTPPDCVSIGGVTGIGEPGGNCAECPFNKFESAEKGNGKACKETKALYLLRPTGSMPCMVSCPPTSLSPIKKYLLRLTDAGLPYHKVVTDITLKKAQNSAGTAYSQLEFTLGGRIAPEEYETIIVPYRGQFNDSMKKATTRDTGDKAPF